MSYDWNEFDEAEKKQPQKQYKDYAPKGEYTVKLDEVEIVDRAGWKSPALRFTWAEDDQYKYPRSVYHWLSIENSKYRHEHNCHILMALGIEKEKAKQLIDNADKDGATRDQLKQGYAALYKKVVERSVSTKIAVQDQYRDNKPVVVTTDKGTTYTPTESDFTAFGARTMERHDTSPLAGAETVSDNLDDIF